MPKGVYDRDRPRCGINLDGPNAKGVACGRPRGHNGRHLSAHALAGMADATRRWRGNRRRAAA
jgi:hypothetical protein